MHMLFFVTKQWRIVNPRRVAAIKRIFGKYQFTVALKLYIFSYSSS